MRKFEGAGDARKYLEKKTPPEEPEKEVDLGPLKEPLFETPEEFSEGHYEFEGKNGLHVSFDLVLTNDAFDNCWQVYRRDLDHIQGKFKPIFAIANLKIETTNFSFRKDGLENSVTIRWLPGLYSTKTEATAIMTYPHIGREVLLMGRDGSFSRAIDFLSLFHELGHSETRSKEEQFTERKEEDKITNQALTLQRERDANAWMLKTAKSLFRDLDITDEQIKDYIHNSQLKSYHRTNREILKENPENKEQTEE